MYSTDLPGTRYMMNRAYVDQASGNTFDTKIRAEKTVMNLTKP